MSQTHNQQCRLQLEQDLHIKDSWVLKRQNDDPIFSFFCSLENLHSLFYVEDQCKNKFDGRHLPLLSSCNLEAILLKVKSGRNFKCMFSFHMNLTKKKLFCGLLRALEFVNGARARVTNADVFWAVQTSDFWTFQINQNRCDVSSG